MAGCTCSKTVAGYASPAPAMARARPAAGCHQMVAGDAGRASSRVEPGRAGPDLAFRSVRNSDVAAALAVQPEHEPLEPRREAAARSRRSACHSVISSGTVMWHQSQLEDLVGAVVAVEPDPSAVGAHVPA